MSKNLLCTHLGNYVGCLHGIIGGGILILIPAFVLIRLEHEEFRGCCPYENHRRNCALLASVLVSCVGILGAGYCFIIAALTLAHEPYCYSTDDTCCHHVSAANGGYQCDNSGSCQCQEPRHVVQWNIAFSSILLILSGIELILCTIQIIQGCLGGAWAVCHGCDKQRCPC
ncbi:transmembrane 4 L6 family member 1-like [Sceloporus undulatus]|uniref:transmembrane 4 L6 family member 1-like n=1 Tax=Sceloporus undulatus TaxID=8520 RepID=UPI001C4AE823|nr:transmembrane 4 L6 family member 1-like [Sceloporus undulatus]